MSSPKDQPEGLSGSSEDTATGGVAGLTTGVSQLTTGEEDSVAPAPEETAAEATVPVPRPVYSHDKAVAAITSFFEFINRAWPDDYFTLEYPPPGGWPEISHETWTYREPNVVKTDAVVQLAKHIPYFVGWDGPQIVLYGELNDWRKITSWHPSNDHPEYRVKMEKAAKRARPDEWSPMLSLTNTRDQKPMFGTELLVDTELGVVIWFQRQDWYQPGNDPIEPELAAHETSWATLHEADLGEDWEYDESEDKGGDERWKISAAYPIDIFFEILKSQYRKMNYMPKLEEGEISFVDEVWEDPPTDSQIKRREILVRCGWPGDGDLNGFDADRARQEMDECEDLV